MEECVDKNINLNFYNPLKVGDIVIVYFYNYKLQYKRHYIDTIKKISLTDKTCRINTFNIDFGLTNYHANPINIQPDWSAVAYTTNEDIFLFTLEQYLKLQKDYLNFHINYNKNNSTALVNKSDMNCILVLLEAMELQNKKNINNFYVLRIDSMFTDMETFIYFYKEKPSIATIRRQIDASCSFKIAEEIYKTEPIDYEYDDLLITLQHIDIGCFEKDVDNEYDMYINNEHESDKTIEFIKEFKQKYPKELEDLHNKLDTLLSIDELIFDWFIDIYFEDDTLEDFKNYLKNNYNLEG